MPPVTVRQSAYKATTIVAVHKGSPKPGRLFLYFSIASDGVSETERGQHEADNSDMRSSFPVKTEVKQLHRELANG